MGVTISVTQRGLKRLMAKMGTHIDPDRMEINLPRVAEDSRLFYLAQEMAGEIRGRAPGRDVVMTSLVTQFLIYLLRFCVVPAAPKRRHQLAHQLPAWEMVRAVECMNHWGKSTFSLARLCAEIGSCQSRFTQLFRNSTNINPLNFYNMLLINKAKSLLACSGMSIKEIAYTLEFQNESHFCTLFRAIAGTTPSRFRIFGDTPTEQVLGNCPVVR
jgi:AraC-like DNA-binding protein